MVCDLLGKPTLPPDSRRQNRQTWPYRLKDAAPLLINEDLYSKHSIKMALHSKGRYLLSTHFNMRVKCPEFYYMKLATVCSSTAMAPMFSNYFSSRTMHHETNPCNPIIQGSGKNLGFINSNSNGRQSKQQHENNVRQDQH